jgi:hypothetical protein
MKSGSIVPPGYISKLNLSHGADTEHDIVVSAGFCKDDTDIMDMYLQNNITKRFDAEWSVGDTNGGMASGEALPTSGTIHIWLIKRSDTGVVDVMANNHATTGLSPTLPSGYDYKRRIFSLRTNSSANIINGDQWGLGRNRIWMYDTYINDVTDTATGTSAKTVAISVPGGLAIKAIVNAAPRIAATNNSLGFNLTWLSNTDNAANSVYTGGFEINNNSERKHYTVPTFVITNTSSQVRYRQDLNQYFYLTTLGWEDCL